MAKKKLPVSIFEIVWYIICALVIIWGLTYVALSLIDKYNDLSSLHSFATSFKKTFGLSLYFWGLIIIAIAAVAATIVLVIYAKTFDKAADREQRRSARLNAIKKDQEQQKVVAEQQAEVVEEPKPAVEEQPKVEEPKEEPKQEETPAEEPAEQPAEEPAPETPAEEPAPNEAPENKEE